MEKQINLKEWKQIGQGGQGKVYRNISNPDLMLKLSNTTRKDIMLKEYELSKYAFEIGISTPQVFDFVTDGKHFGYIGQFIKGKKSLCRILADDPSRLEEMVHLFTENVRRLHSRKADVTRLESRQQTAVSDLEKIRFLKPETLKSIIDLFNSIPVSETCVHGDLHFGNLITTGEKQYWIDLGRFKYGNPILDISQFYFVFEHLPIVCKHIFHLKAEQCREFFNLFVNEYYGLDDDSKRAQYEELLHKAVLAQLVGIILNKPLAVWFIPKLQKHLGLKPYSRLRIIGMLLTGHKQIF